MRFTKDIGERTAINHGAVVTAEMAFHQLKCYWAALVAGEEPDADFKHEWNVLADIARAAHIVPKYPDEPRVITRVMDDGIKTKDGAA